MATSPRTRTPTSSPSGARRATEGPRTIRLQSSGISLLAPRLSILDSHGNVVADARASSGFGDAVTLRLGTLDPGTTYYVRALGATSDAFGIGGYGLAVTFDAASRVAPAALDSVLRGPYQSLSPNDIAALFNLPLGDVFQRRSPRQ